jgi:hypothetical protein
MVGLRQHGDVAAKTGEVDAKADPNLIGMLVVSAYLTVALSEKVATAIDLLLEGVLTTSTLAPRACRGRRA